MAGRPVKYTKDKLEEIRLALEKYIKTTKIPIIAEFAYKNDIPREELYRHKELNHTIKKLINKKEAQLEILALTKKIDSKMAIFGLKQLGWKDKQDIEVTEKPTVIRNTIKKEDLNLSNDENFVIHT